jgi:hypothetical protein
VKKLLAMLLLVCVGAGVGYVWFRQSVHYAILEIGAAAKEGDVHRLEKHLDLRGFSESAALFVAQVAKAGTKGALGNGLLGELAGSFAGAITKELATGARPELEATIRRSIAQGDAFEAFGPFRPHESYKAIGAVREQGSGKVLVTLVGTCYAEPASMNVVFERQPGAFGVELLGHWKATGAEEGSLLLLAEQCKAGAKRR